MRTPHWRTELEGTKRSAFHTLIAEPGGSSLLNSESRSVPGVACYLESAKGRAVMPEVSKWLRALGYDLRSDGQKVVL